MKKLSNLEFVILSLVSEKPIHGYQIEQTINERGMREWTDIGFSSIYHVLNKLLGSGMLTSQLKTVHERPARKVFTLTPNGMDLLRAEIYHRLSTPQPYSPDFDLALSSLPMLSKEEIRSAVINFKSQLTEKIAEVEEKQARIQPFSEKHIKDLFAHSLHAMQCELDWVSNYLIEME